MKINGKTRGGEAWASMFAVVHWTPKGGLYVGSLMFETEEAAKRHSDTMPDFIREGGDEDGARNWEAGNHVVVPVRMMIPRGMEVRHAR